MLGHDTGTGTQSELQYCTAAQNADRFVINGSDSTQDTRDCRLQRQSQPIYRTGSESTNALWAGLVDRFLGAHRESGFMRPDSLRGLRSRHTQTHALRKIPPPITLVVRMPVEAEDWTFLYCGKMPPSFDDLVPAASTRAGNIGSSPGTATVYPAYLSPEEILIRSHLRAALERERLIRVFGERQCQSLKEDLALLKESCDYQR